MGAGMVKCEQPFHFTSIGIQQFFQFLYNRSGLDFISLKSKDSQGLGPAGSYYPIMHAEVRAFMTTQKDGHGTRDAIQYNGC